MKILKSIWSWFILGTSHCLLSLPYMLGKGMITRSKQLRSSLMKHLKPKSSLFILGRGETFNNQNAKCWMNYLSLFSKETGEAERERSFMCQFLRNLYHYISMLILSLGFRRLSSSLSLFNKRYKELSWFIFKICFSHPELFLWNLELWVFGLEIPLVSWDIYHRSAPLRLWAICATGRISSTHWRVPCES